MKRTAVVSLLMILCGARVQPHQLDEYLQATLLDLSGDRVRVELSLTPGAAIAPQILALIDRDRDGVLSPTETAEYAGRMMREVHLTIDGRACRLTVTRAVAPAWEELVEGTGSIRLDAVAEGALLTGGAHRIVYENTHQPAPSAYLANALKPRREVTIDAQRRDVLQHRIELDIEVSTGATRAAQFAWGSGLIAALVTLRVRSRRRRQAPRLAA